MNNLSWFLYWADVVPNIFALIACVAFLTTLFGLGCFFVFAIQANAYKQCGEDDKDYKLAKKLSKIGTRVALAGAIVVVLIHFVPSRDTIYAIAASEVTEDVLKSPEASKARNVLNKALDKLDKSLSEPEAKSE